MLTNEKYFQKESGLFKINYNIIILRDVYLIRANELIKQLNFKNRKAENEAEMESRNLNPDLAKN